MPLDINTIQPSVDIMLEEIGALENEAFFAEKKIRDISNILDHARVLLDMKPDDLEEAASIREDIDQLLLASITIAQTGQAASPK
jgi:hypothetical protein